jgi:hypothetical protein
MSIAARLRGALSGNSGVTTLVSTRIYPLKLPQNPTYEAISFQRISNTPTNGNTDLRESRWQINCWADTYVESQALALAVKTALEEYKDTTATPGIKQAYVANEQDDYDDDAKVFRTIVDVILVTTGD